MSGVVLYIEDNPESMLLVRRAIEGIGLTLFGAVSGQEGLVRASVLQPSVILLDLSLPDVDGFEVARRLRCCPEEELRYVPIIAVTESTRRGEVEKAIASGCDVCITRPLNIHELWERVESFIAFGS